MSRLQRVARTLGESGWREVLWRARLGIKRVDLRHADLGALTDHWYTNTGLPDLDTVLETLDIGPGDAIIDVGCGKGGTLLRFARHPFDRIAGVDLAADLVDVATENLKKMRVTNARLYCADAAEFRALDEYNHLYLANPFPCDVMQAFMTNVAESVARSPRRMTIVYYNPKCHDTILDTGLFQRSAEWQPTTLRHPFFIYRLLDEATR